MREAVEYATGIFHGSIMAIQSEGEGGDESGRERGRNLSFRCTSDAIYPEENPGERDVPLECALHLSRRDPVGVFFLFPGNQTEKGA